MQNIDREHSGAVRLRRIGRLGAAIAALAFLLPVSTASATPGPAPALVASERVADVAMGESPSPSAAAVGHPAEKRIELAQRRDGNNDKPPDRGSSAQLEGGSSADRYGGSSADRRGVAGRYDPRNRGVRQYSASNRKRDRERPKESDELDDQDDDPPRDRYSFTPADPSQVLGRGNRDRD